MDHPRLMEAQWRREAAGFRQRGHAIRRKDRDIAGVVRADLFEGGRVEAGAGHGLHPQAQHRRVVGRLRIPGQVGPHERAARPEPVRKPAPAKPAAPAAPRIPVVEPMRGEGEVFRF